MRSEASQPTSKTAKQAEAPLILVVDDEKSFARRLALEFEEAGYRAIAAYDGYEAMAALEECTPDVIVLDVRMPGMDGIQCLRKLHRDRGTLPPVILLTGDTNPRIDAVALVYPGSFVLSKPCTYEQVIRVATRLLSLPDD